MVVATENQAEILMGIIYDAGLEFFHDETKTPYTEILINDHREIMPVKSSKFKTLFKKVYYDKQKKPLKTSALNEVIYRFVSQNMMKPHFSTT